jgi:hypothetical protein
MIRKAVTFICLISIISCVKKEKMPEDILKPDKMQSVLWDVLKADALVAQIIIKDTTKKADAENLRLQQEVFRIHNISRATFEKSYSYYKENPGKLKQIIDSVIVQAERNRPGNINIKPIEAQ